MTPPEPDADAPQRPMEGDAQYTPHPSGHASELAPIQVPSPQPADDDSPENTLSPASQAPADRHGSRLKRPTHPGRPIHAPGASGLIEASEVPIANPTSRPSSRPVQRPTSVLGAAPISRPLPRPTDPLAPATAAPPFPASSSEVAPRPPSSRPPTLRPATPRRDTPTALSGPLSAPPGTSPLSPTRPDLDLEASRPDAPKPSPPGLPHSRADALPALPNPLDLPLAPSHRPMDSAPSTLSTPYVDDARAAPPRAPLVVIGLAFLIALLLPTSARPPWALLDQPAGPTALALAGLLLLPGLTAGPPHLVRWALRLVVVVTLTALTALALSDGYTHPPWGDALDPLHGSLTLLGLSLLIASALAASAERAPRIVASVGLLLLIAAALIPAESGVPLLRLVDTLTASASTAADTAAALATLTFAALALATALVRVSSPRRRLLLGLVVWTGAIAPLLLHAALSTAPAAWMEALAPLKSTLAFAAALLCCATAITPALEPEPPQPGPGQAF